MLLICNFPPSMRPSAFGVLAGPELPLVVETIDDSMPSGSELFLDQLNNVLEEGPQRDVGLRILADPVHGDEQQVGLHASQLPHARLAAVHVTKAPPQLLPPDVKAEALQGIEVAVILTGVDHPD